MRQLGFPPSFRRAAAGILALALACLALRGAFLCYYRAAYPLGYRELVLAQSGEQGLPPSLVFAVIRTESGFRTGARSDAEALGLMQITRQTFDWAQMRRGESGGMAFTDLYDPAVNITYGATILALLLEEFGSVENALCAYHAGWGSVKKWLEDPACSNDGVTLYRIPSPVTAHYVDKVLEAQEYYNRLYDL